MEDFLVSMNRKKREAREQYTQLDPNRARVCMIVVLALSIAAIGLMAFWNRQPSGSHYTYTTASDIWYLEDSDMQIAAPEAD